MREWLLARLRGSGSSSRRAMLARASNEMDDEEKDGTALGAKEEGKESSPHTTNGVSLATSTISSSSPSPRRTPRHLPSPVRMYRSESDRHSSRSLAESVLTSLHHVKLHKKTFRLLIASLVLLAAFLVLLLVVSLIYGFGLQFPQVSVLGTDALSPGLLDAKGNIPLRSYLTFSNPNIFRLYVKPSVVTIYTDAGRTHVLGEARVPALALHAHEMNRTVASEYAIEGIMQVPGGKELVQRVAQGRPTLFYTTSVIGLRVKGLGFVPVMRRYEVRCRLLKLWPKPKGPGGGNNATAAAGEGDGEDVSVADCHGRFL